MTINDEKMTQAHFYNPQKRWPMTIVTVISPNFHIYTNSTIILFSLYEVLEILYRHLSIINDLQRIQRQYRDTRKHFNDLAKITLKPVRTGG